MLESFEEDDLNVIMSFVDKLSSIETNNTPLNSDWLSTFLKRVEYFNNSRDFGQLLIEKGEHFFQVTLVRQKDRQYKQLITYLNVFLESSSQAKMIERFLNVAC